MVGSPFLSPMAVVPAPPWWQTALTLFSANSQSWGMLPAMSVLPSSSAEDLTFQDEHLGRYVRSSKSTPSGTDKGSDTGGFDGRHDGF